MSGLSGHYTLLLTGFLVSYSRAFARLPDDLKAVPLFTKPTVSTGRLEVSQAGLDVLRAQKEPFAIISAVGPTRTGKSATLGRAFFRGKHENLFEVGGGVKSFTTGVWITNKPLEVDTGNGKTLRVLFIDSEGFSGVGGVTSRTYEANLFGIIYLLSSAVIFNTMFPVDASTVANLNAHASHALHMVQALQEGGRRVLRRKPQLIWSVQSFNMFNLRNDGINAEDLFSALRNASQPDASVEPAFRAVLGGVGRSLQYRGLLVTSSMNSSLFLCGGRTPQTRLLPTWAGMTVRCSLKSICKYTCSLHPHALAPLHPHAVACLIPPHIAR